MFTHLYRQSISCILSSVLLGNALYAGGIVVDTTAAQKYQAQMDTTANGIPLINIVAPNSSGLSHNKFNDFNINPSGLILNNATTAVLTQLGGYVQANTNLGTTPARVILNEVTGTNRSYLRGYGEVAGSAADVIVANPNGITVNGGGFINTPHATLTTGTPEFSGSALSGFHVQRGDILIEGTGLNASNIDRVDLYTKILQLNGQIYANKLDVVTGENHITTDGTVTPDNVTGTEVYSIDSSALGGIYANVIRLVGTDKGVGVNLPPITYASNSLQLSADGKIVIGTAYATNAINLTSAHGDISLTNALSADSLTLVTSKTFTNTGSVSVNNASVHADTLNNESGATLAAKKMDAALTSDVNNAGALIAEDVTIHAQNLTNSGSMLTNTMALNLIHSLSNTGSISASTALAVNASDMSNGVGGYLAAKELNLALGNTMSNEGTLVGDTVALSTQSFTNSGNINTNTLNINALNALNNAGTITASVSAQANTSLFTNTSVGTFSATALNIASTTDVNNAGILSGGDVTLHAQNLSNSGSLISDTMALNLIHSLSNTGSISASTALAMNASDMSNGLGGYLAAKGLTITVGNNLLNEGELIGENISLSADGMHNIGNMYADTMSVHLNHALTNENMISVFNTFALTGSQLANRSSATLEATHMNLNLSSSIANQGMLHASALSIVTPTLTNDANIIADTLSIDGTDVTNNGLIKGDTSTGITTTNSITNNGGIIGGNQLTLHANTITNTQVLYSANAIDLSAADTLRNTQGSSIISGGTIAIHDTGTLSNEVATIQSDGDMIIQSRNVENISTNVPTKTSTSSSTSELITLSLLTADMRNTSTTTDSIDKSGYTPAFILSGGNMSIDAAIHNRYSMIAANGDMYLSGSLNNEAAIDAHTVIDTTHNYLYFTQNDSTWHLGYITYDHTDTITDHTYSTIQAGGNMYGNLISVNNADVVSGIPVTSFSSQGIPASPTLGAITLANAQYGHYNPVSPNTTYTLPSNQYGQFIKVTDPSLPYLVESNPLYTNYNTFIGSDYMMSHLNLTMGVTTKRLGDNMYETQLVRDAVFRLTGERYLAGFGSDTAEYKTLMDNALAVQGNLHLELGVSLSAAQVAALNRDIVWMEDRVVSGQHVLVPVVYLASLKTAELSGGGKIIAGGDMQLSVTDGINNGGEIRAGGTLIAVADRIANTGGSFKSTGDMFLHTLNDITNTSGTIKGNNVALISDNGNIISQTALTSIDLSNHIVTSGNLSAVGEKASIQAAGDMLINAAKNITFVGTQTSAGGNATLGSTSGNVTLAALEQNSHYKSAWSEGSNELGSVTQHASSLNATGDVSINAAKNVSLVSSAIDGKNIALSAGGNVSLSAASDRAFTEIQSHGKKSSLLSSTSTNTRDMTDTSTSVASHINGESVSINSGNDLSVQGSNVISNSGTTLSAAHDITILSATDTSAESHFKEVKKSGFYMNYSAGVSSVGYDKSKNTSEDDLQSTQQVASNIVSLNGNTTLSANNHLQVSASNLEAGKNLTLTAKSIDILEAQNTQSEQYAQQSSSKGVSVGITRNPYLAAKSAYQGAKGNTPATGGVMNKLSREFEGSNAAVGAAMTPIVVTAHNTSSSTNGTQETSSAALSTLTAGGNLTILATDGSINSQGSQMSAEGNALLLAKENINLDVAHSSESAATNTAAHGFTLDNRASANTPDQIWGTYKNKGAGSGATDTITGTQLSVGGSATLGTTQGDIAITGGNVVANNDLTINAARNLTIQSSQNTTDNKNISNDKAIGKVYISDTERFSGYHTELHKDNGTDVTQVSTNVASLGGNVNLNAGEAYTQSASNVMAANDVNIKAKTIDITTADNTGTSSTEDKALKIGGFARVSSPLIDLINSVDTASKSDGRLQTMQEMAVAANAYRAGSAITAIQTKGDAGSGSIVSAEVGVGFTTSKNAQNANTNNAQASTINGGNNVTLTTTQGDIHASGATITAGKTLSLDSAKDILLDAGVNKDHSDGKNSGYGAEVGVGVSVGAKIGVYAYVGVQASKGKSLSDSTAYDNTHLTADTINLKANDNLTLAGADARANTINADAGKTLTIESLQDTAKSTSSESGLNARVQVSFGTAWGAGENKSTSDTKSKGGSVGINFAGANGEYKGVNQQSGLFALDGGYHVNADSINLIGGAISSTNPANSTLTTNTLTLANLRNEMSYSATTASISGGANSSGEGNKAQTTPNVTAIPPIHEEKKEITTTYATITDGTIKIGGVTTNSAASLGAHTDLATAHTAVEKLPDLKVLLSNQQAMAAAATTVIKTSGQISNDIATSAEKTKTDMKPNVINSLSPKDQIAYNNAATETEKEQILRTANSSYNEAATTLEHWGVGGDYSRALGVITNIVVGSTAGQGTTQLASNAVAPYAAELIGNTFAHTDNPNEAAQLLSHAVLGGVLAYVNGGNAASGTIAGAGAEAAALSIAKELYPNAFVNGVLDRSKLTEEQANGIVALSSGIGALVGGISGGGITGATIDANVAKNAVENNGLVTKVISKIVEKAIEVAKRPTWRQSEKDVASKYGDDAKTQVSYKDGQEVVSGTKGSVKPDVVVNDTAIEVKNYSIDNASNMVNTIAKQVNQRADHLPDGMTQQVVIDFRGQNVSPAQIATIRQSIIDKTNGILTPNQIKFNY